ncbi:hydrolase [Enterococcus gallinarum]|jgi:pentose-5-phosphate-3-epimerase|uniref:Hydrolase n=4 Tax=Enterococcus TaxID=1350 RepID=A0A3N3W9P1_ENTGA|nr:MULTISPECIES: hydrolase [Enterococcus]MBF0820918.1 hydrolase [Enterococcus faecalis]AYY10528.1 hydrolase [Enterococcus sp. FDAARGOS_553]MBA0949113.1 hydrolase [Enterococcus gallinarum]MBA0962117.1 hydrolase [Enterococcus gallinarum]MBA0970061.1 hydrolase [Enterococcus gallinarum]
MEEKYMPKITTELRKDIVKVPKVIRQASGIQIFGKQIRSIIFTTDIAIIRNTNADAVIAVYPFTPHPAITKAIIEAADIPVFSGVGGGLTQGFRSSYMSMFAEAQGSIGVVLNGPTPLKTVEQVCKVIDIPVISTVTSKYTKIDEKLKLGVKVINISAGKKTAETVRYFRERYPELPIIATGGPTDESILETIEAGANAITYTPPSNGELFSKKMQHYREMEKPD